MKLSYTQTHGLADFLLNSLEHFSGISEAQKFIEDEFELSSSYAKTILEKWNQVEPKEKLRLGLSNSDICHWLQESVNQGDS